MRNKHLQKLIGFSWPIWILIGLGPNLLLQNIDAYQALSLFVLIVLTLFIGDAILQSAGLAKKQFSSLSWGGLSFLTALLILIPTLFIPFWSVVVYCLLLVSIILTLKKKNRNFENTVWTLKPELLYFAAAILAVLLINHGEILKFPYINHVFSPAEKNPDSAFFTAIVATYAGDHSQGAAFEMGTPIQYHIFSYLFPAVIKQFTGVSSFVAYNHIFCPISYLLFYLLLIDLSKQLFSKTTKSSPVVYALVPIAYILLVPINPLGLLSLDPNRVIWGGPGFMAPGGNLASSIGLILTVLCLMIWHKARKKIIFHRQVQLAALFTILLLLLLINKVTFFVAVAVFCFFDQLFILLKKKELPVLYHSLRLGSIFLILFVAFNALGSQNDVSINLDYGYLVSQFNILNLESPLLALLGTVALFMFWLLSRAIMVFFSRSSEYALYSFLAATLTILVLALPSILFRVEASAHNHIVDKTFDLVQFIRAGFAIASILAASFVPIAITSNQRIVKPVLLGLTLLIGPTYVVRIIEAQRPKNSEQQYTSEFPATIKGKLTAVYPIDNFRSMQIASPGLLQIYSAMDFSANGGYNIGSLYPNRWQNISNLDNKQLSLKDKLLPLQHDSVEYLITIKEFQEPLDSMEIIFENEVLVLQNISTKH